MFRPRFRALFFSLTLAGNALLFSAPVSAQDADSQLWLQMTVNARFRNRLRLFGEFQPRWGNNYTRSTQLAVRTAAGYQVQKNFSVWLGYNWQPSFFPEFNNEDRYYQQFLWEDRYPHFDLSNRTRLEERSIAGAGGIALRLRHQVKLSYPLDTKKRWSVFASNELFWNLNSTPSGPEAGFDQDRLGFGVAYNMTRHLRLEIGYIANFINPPQHRPDRRLDVLSLGIHYSL